MPLKRASPNGTANPVKNASLKAQPTPNAPNGLELMKENQRLRKELEEIKKEAAFFAKEIDQRLIDPSKLITTYKITGIYHEHNGVDGHRGMKAYLERKGYTLSILIKIRLQYLLVFRKNTPSQATSFII